MAQMTYAGAARAALMQEMARDPTVWVLGEDVGPEGGAGGQYEGLLASFGPERVVDTPISESMIMAAGVGAAAKQQSMARWFRAGGKGDGCSVAPSVASGSAFALLAHSARRCAVPHVNPTLTIGAAPGPIAPAFSKILRNSANNSSPRQNPYRFNSDTNAITIWSGTSQHGPAVGGALMCGPK